MTPTPAPGPKAVIPGGRSYGRSDNVLLRQRFSMRRSTMLIATERPRSLERRFRHLDFPPLTHPGQTPGQRSTPTPRLPLRSLR